MTIQYHKYIDATGLKCPQPLLLVKQGIININVNEVLLIDATDSHTDLDLEVWCERFGHHLFKTEINDGVYKFWIKKN